MASPYPIKCESGGFANVNRPEGRYRQSTKIIKKMLYDSRYNVQIDES